MTERKTIDVTEVAKDNHEALRHIRVCFTESKYDFDTDINGTMDDVVNYYVGASLNVGSYPEEIIKTPRKILFIPRTDSEPIVQYHLPSQKSRLYRGYEIEYVAPPIGTRAFDWQFTAIGYDGPEDSRCGSAASLEEVKTRIDEWIEDDLFEEEKLQNIGSDR